MASWKTTHTPKIKDRIHVDEYNMDHKFKGLAVIISKNFKPKNSSEIPDENVTIYTELFQVLGFTVETCETDNEMHDILTRYAGDARHKDHSCFVCCIITKDNGHHSISHIPPYWMYLDKYFTANECPFLAGKPKLFFMHFKKDSYIETDGAPMATELKTTFIIPKACDFFIFTCNDTTRCDNISSNTVSEVLKLSHETRGDFITAITSANQQIVDISESKVIPIIFSTLTGKIYL